MPKPFAPEERLPGQLGEFAIEGLLGEGGSGTVYAARWKGRQVALKVLRQSLLPSARERRQFQREALLISSIEHPSVVRVLTSGELPDGRPYLVMERLLGTSLAARLESGPLTIEEALSGFTQLANAVAVLHAQGLIHRDIKPENAFLVQGGPTVLLDFGIEKPAGAADSTVTREGGVRGTPAYMAPERFFGAAANERTDIYELAVVLYVMVTGLLPWANAADTASRLNPQRPSSLGVVLPGTLEDVLLDALSSRAECRPSTISELLRQIQQAIESQAQPARETADLSSSPAARRWSYPVTGPAALVTPPSSGGGEHLAYQPTVSLESAISTPGHAPDHRSSQPPFPKSPPSRKRWGVVVVLVLLVGAGASLAYWYGQRQGSRSSRDSLAGVAPAKPAPDASAADTPLAVRDAGVVTTYPPDAGTATTKPAEQVVNSKLKQRTGVLDGVAKKTSKSAKKTIAGARSKKAPGGNKAASKPPAGHAAVLLLVNYMRRKDHIGCARASLAQPPSDTVLNMGLSCALYIRNNALVRRICSKLKRLYPSSRWTKRCQKHLASVEKAAKNSKVRHKRKRQTEERIRKLQQERRQLREHRRKQLQEMRDRRRERRQKRR